MFLHSIKKLNPFKKFKQFNTSKDSLDVPIRKNSLDFHSGTVCDELNRLNSLNGKKFGAGDGDRTRDVQLGKLAFYR